MPLFDIIDDVKATLRVSRSAVEACQVAVATLQDGTSATLCSALLHVKDQLRCVAATGTWHTFSTVPLGHGVVGRVYYLGQPVTVLDVESDPDFIRLGPDVRAEICVPIMDRARQPIGALNVEWTTPPVDVRQWQDTLTEIGRLLGERVDELGGPPPETRDEQLLRHAVALTGAESDTEVLRLACRAAREVTGLTAAVLLRPEPTGPDDADLVTIAASSPEARDRPLVERLSKVDPERLATMLERAARHGTSYTLGDPANLDAYGFEALTEAGVRTMIAVPLGIGAPAGVLIALDEAAVRPDPSTVNLLELLAAQAATCLQKLATVRRLHQQATSDPLTGLRHGGPFGLRLANATPGRTALLAIDIDQFKTVNDTQGHAAGDRVLIELSRALQQALRQGDELFRIGGDEFVAVIDVPSAAEALVVADRLVDAARATDNTISVGVAVQHSGESPEAALHRADLALYAVKRAGRNGVRLAS